MLSRPLLTTHDVADMLKVKEATVRAWIRAGELPAVQLHREWRVTVKHLEEFVASRLSIEPTGTKGSAVEPAVDVVGSRSTHNPRRAQRANATAKDAADD